MGKGKKRHVVLLDFIFRKKLRRIEFLYWQIGNGMPGESDSSFLFLKIEFIFMKAASGKDIAKPSTIAIPWIYVPMASKLEAAPLKQPRHNGTFHLME